MSLTLENTETTKKSGEMSSKVCASDFDAEDEVSYYYGNLQRDHVKEILNDAAIGTFLIRDSTKDFDQKVTRFNFF